MDVTPPLPTRAAPPPPTRPHSSFDEATTTTTAVATPPSRPTPPPRDRSNSLSATMPITNITAGGISPIAPRPLPTPPAKEQQQHSGALESSSMRPLPSIPQRVRGKTKLPPFAPPPPPSGLRESVHKSSLESPSTTQHKYSEEEAAVIIQSLYRGWKARKLYAVRRKEVRMRRKVVEEIVETEKVYLDTLDDLVQYFIVPLQVAPEKILPEKQELRLIFPSTIEVIMGYNGSLLEDINKRVQTWSNTQLIGDIFLKMTAYLKVYTDYVKSYEEALRAAERHLQNPHFATFIKDAFERMAAHTKRSAVIRDLPALLITPVQRIPRYTILLNELVKYTWEDHPDRNNLEQALRKMKDVAEYLNERARETEAAMKLARIQQNLIKTDETIIDSHRKLIREGPLYLLKNSGRESMALKKQYFFLFNDILLCTKLTKYSKYRFIAKYGLVRAELVDHKQIDIDVEYMRHTFEIKIGSSVCLWVSASSAEEKQAWYTDLSNVIEEVKERSSFIDHHNMKLAAQRAEKAKALLQQQYATMDKHTAEKTLEELEKHSTPFVDHDINDLKQMIEKRYAGIALETNDSQIISDTTESVVLNEKQKKKSKDTLTSAITLSIKKRFKASISKATGSSYKESEEDHGASKSKSTEESPTRDTRSPSSEAPAPALRKHATIQRSTFSKATGSDLPKEVVPESTKKMPDAGGSLRKHATHRMSSKMDPQPAISGIIPAAKPEEPQQQPAMRKHAAMRRATVTAPIK